MNNSYYRQTNRHPLSCISTVFAFSVLVCGFISDPVGTISNALKTGDSRTVASYFGKSVDLTLLDREDTYSSSQSELMLKDFFSKYPPKSFQLVHNGSNKGAAFAIGTLTTTNGKKLRVSFHLHDSGGKTILQELSIQED